MKFITKIIEVATEKLYSVRNVIKITLKKKRLLAARIAELILMVLTRKIGVPITVQEESIHSPSSPTKYQGQINVEKRV
jgi:hypothetical protein